MEKVSHNHKDNSQVWITYKILLQLQLPSACNLANTMELICAICFVTFVRKIG